MIRSFLYAMPSRQNIMHDVGLIAIFQDTPKETHVKVMKRIFKYLKGTLYLGLWYPCSDKIKLEVYIDAY